jgi:hypothetical protein
MLFNVFESDYHWEELWRSLFLVLDFAANQIGTLKSVAKVDELVQDVSLTAQVRLQLISVLGHMPSGGRRAFCGTFFADATIAASIRGMCCCS